jgi:hypothetical protein
MRGEAGLLQSHMTQPNCHSPEGHRGNGDSLEHRSWSDPMSSHTLQQALEFVLTPLDKDNEEIPPGNMLCSVC